MNHTNIQKRSRNLHSVVAHSIGSHKVRITEPDVKMPKVSPPVEMTPSLGQQHCETNEQTSNRCLLLMVWIQLSQKWYHMRRCCSPYVVYPWISFQSIAEGKTGRRKMDTLIARPKMRYPTWFKITYISVVKIATFWFLLASFNSTLYTSEFMTVLHCLETRNY